MDTTSVGRHKGRHKARTNSGKFLSLQADYRRGRLTEASEERFERIVLEVGRLYKGV